MNNEQQETFVATCGGFSVHEIWIFVVIMVLAGLFGGYVQHLSEHKVGRFNAAVVAGRGKTLSSRIGFLHSLMSGVAAAVMVPLFLQTISSNLLKGNDPGKFLIFAGVCLAASICSSKFIQGMSEKILQDIQDVQKDVAVKLKKMDANTAATRMAEKQWEYNSVSVEDLKNVFAAASPESRRRIYREYSRQREQHWQAEKYRLDRVIRIFEALIEAGKTETGEEDGYLYQCYFDLGLSFKDRPKGSVIKTIDDYHEAIKNFSQAIKYRKEANPYHEMQRALTNVLLYQLLQEEAVQRGLPVKESERKQREESILADLTAAGDARDLLSQDDKTLLANWQSALKK
ncbi:MAG TPA: YEATS-associated helix-containing protein [Patescibacteria group bacterium]|nr:YEATS-associated helix-containing protein [Patescibacteria group bacterium]